MPKVFRVPVTMTRRAALLAAAAVPLSACGADSTGSAAAPADPDRLIRERAAEAERVIITRYRETAVTHTDLEPALAEFVARHERHLNEILGTTPPTADEPSTAPGPRDAVPDDIPTSRADAISALREAEAAHATARTDDSITTYDYELARVFASVAACESAHEYLLGEMA